MVVGPVWGLTPPRSFPPSRSVKSWTARTNHTFQPLLYQVATAACPPVKLPPIRWILRGHSNIEVLLEKSGEVQI